MGFQAPYQLKTKADTGRFFYNVNSTFYIWYDSWAAAKAGTRAHGDHTGWPNMPPQQIPTARRYLTTHSPQQILGRIQHGGDTVLDKVEDSYGYHRFVILYGGLLGLAAAWRRGRALDGVRGNGTLGLFLLLYFAGYALLYFWYAPISSGNRLILGQFMPLMFVIFVALERLLEDDQLHVGGYTISWSSAVHVAVMTFLIVDIYFIVTERVVTIVGGF